MSTPKQNGGPAFPLPIADIESRANGCEWNYCGGMSMRQYYAAKALTGELSSQSLQLGFYLADHESQMSLARRCWAIADAMIEAESETTTQEVKNGTDV